MFKILLERVFILVKSSNFDCFVWSYSFGIDIIYYGLYRDSVYYREKTFYFYYI